MYMHDLPLIQTQSLLFDRAVVTHIALYERMSDQDLVQLSMQRDEQAYQNLINRYRYQITSYILHLLNFQRQDADEVASETWVKIYQNLSQYNPHKSFSAWVYRIAHNASIDTIRRNSRVYTRDISTIRESQISTVIDWDKPSSDEIKYVLDNLKPEDKDLLTMKYTQDLTVPEIAAALSLSNTLVSVKLFRARVRARKIAATIRPETQV
jgi:RNA polymerase sigma factor (sigma-70 family)